MIELPCSLGLRAPEALLPRWLQENPGSIGEVIAEQSNGRIRLHIDESRIGNPLSTQPGVIYGLELHDASDTLTGNAEVGCLRGISIIFADTLAYHEPVLGLMFDHGISELPGGDAVAAHIPREGCAVFLGSIAALRGAAQNGHHILDQAYEDETFFTTIHELGHVFNLGHVGRPDDPSYMTQSDSVAPYPRSRWQFTPDQRALLKHPEDPSVRPGCEPFSAFSPFSLPKRARRPRGESLALEIAMHRDSFLPFEPVELDVRLRVRRGHHTATVPDRIDPGYREFVIWIDEPSGERRRYRSPRHYCLQPARRKLSQSAPFARDVSIFLEPGSYTFRRPGTHRIWAEFEISASRRLRSNTIEVEVRSPIREGGDAIALRRVLRTANARKLLYHRTLSSLDEATPLEDVCSQLPDSAVIAGVRYALGRAYAREGGGFTARAREYLERAANDRELSDHQRRHCGKEIERLRDGMNARTARR